MPIQVAKDGSYKGFGGPQLVEHLQERQEELRLMAGYPSRSLLLCLHLRKNWVVVEHQSLLHGLREVKLKDQSVQVAGRQNWNEPQELELKNKAVGYPHQNLLEVSLELEGD